MRFSALSLATLLVAGFPATVESASPQPETQAHQASEHIPFARHPLFRSWHRNWDQGALASVRTGRPLMVLAVQDGCPECQRTLDTLNSLKGTRGLFSGRERLLLDVGGSAVALDTAQQMGITRTPTLVVYRPSEGQMVEVGRKTGAMTIDDVRNLDRLSRHPTTGTAADDQPTTKTRRRRP